MALTTSQVTKISAGMIALSVLATGCNTASFNEAVEENFPVCEVDSLPVEATHTIEDISSAGPYQFPDNDNTRFGNYEGILPEEELGYYREYTVITPELNHRGPRRIVTGGGTEADPDVWYYTDDHYETFCEIPDAEQ